jgi:sortase A
LFFEINNIKYTTVYGTRTYAVIFVGTISSTDWTYLEPTADNRITLITCLADWPELRVCVVATEK